MVFVIGVAAYLMLHSACARVVNSIYFILLIVLHIPPASGLLRLLRGDAVTPQRKLRARLQQCRQPAIALYFIDTLQTASHWLIAAAGAWCLKFIPGATENLKN